MVPREDFLQLLRENSDLSFAVIGWMCNMLREKTAIIQNLATSSPEHRIGTILFDWPKRRSIRTGSYNAPPRRHCQNGRPDNRNYYQSR